MSKKTKLCLAGAGLIGRRHVEVMQQSMIDAVIESVVDPSEQGRQFALEIKAKWYPTLTDMFKVSQPDGVIIATPNQVHIENGLDCVAARCPMLIEKPIATDCSEARLLVDAAKAAHTPILVGHHRRHNHLIKQAFDMINNGDIGKVTSVHANCWFYKPDEYFAPKWRREAGAGPILVNTIHDIDLLRYLCGDVQSVQAMSSNNVRGFDTEDSAVVLLKFASGALGTMSVSDTVKSPWSWEMTSAENPDFSSTNQSCYMIGGTKGSLSVPDLSLWKHEGEGHWKSPISATSFAKTNVDPLVTQLRHFIDVIHSNATPLVSGEEGLKSLKVVEAIKHSATTGQTVFLENG